MATSTVSPGNIVVPLSAIIDQLQGKLSHSEIEALLHAIISQKKQEVRPGDLITAELMNQILTDLADLNIRMAQLEGSAGGPLILGRVPTGDVAVHEKLTVLGTGFDSQSARNTVMLDSVEVKTFFAESDENRLAFQVPDLFTGLPRLVDLRVLVGGQTSNTVKVRVQPKTELQGGNVVIFSQTGSLGQINVGESYALQWLVDSQTALPATYRFKLLFSDLAGATEADWVANSALTPSTEMQIVRGNPLAVSATVTVPAGATKAQIALQVQTSDGAATRTSDPIAFVVGSTPQVSDPRAKVTLPATLGPFDATGQPNPLRTAKITVGGNQLDGLQLKFGQTGDIPLDLFVTTDPTAAGDYAYSAEVEDPQSAWQIMSITPLQDFAVPVGNHRTITVKLKHTDPTNATTVKYMVVRAQHSPAGSSTPDFMSFIRFPIQGFSS